MADVPKAGDGTPAAYVNRVRQDTQRYMEELLAENERLRRLGAELEADRRRLAEDFEGLRRRLADTEGELDRFRHAQEQLHQQLGDVEQENHRFSEQFLEVERRNNDLAHLYVATYRLHATLDHREVLLAIEEIVINLIGSEVFAVFERAPGESNLTMVGAFGLASERFPGGVVPGRGVLGRVVESGEILLVDLAGGPLENALATEENLTAAIPLTVDGRVLGLVAIFDLLPQKGGQLAPLDRELIDILATQAAPALYCSSLHARYGGKSGA
jgi:GAF domain